MQSHCLSDEFDERAELPETVIAQAEEYLLRGWAGARFKTSAFDQLQGAIASEGRRLQCVSVGWERDGGTLKPLKCHSSLSTNTLSMCKCVNVLRCSARAKNVVVMCVIYCHKSQVRNCQNRY